MNTEHDCASGQAEKGQEWWDMSLWLTACPLPAVAVPWEDVFPALSPPAQHYLFAHGYTALSLPGAAQLLRLQFQFVKLGPVQL